MRLLKKTRAKRKRLHPFHRILRRLNVGDHVGHIFASKSDIGRVENIVKRALRSLNLRRQQGFLANVHRQIHRGIRNKSEHTFKLANLPRAGAEQLYSVRAKLQGGHVR